MQNQYFGDIGDFAKYGILRHFAAAGVALGVQWYLVPDGRGQPGDGRHVGYLVRPDLYRPLDPVLFDALAAAVHAGRRDVREVEARGLVPGARTYGALMTFAGRGAATARQAWHRAALAALAPSELVFVDPDNGLASEAPTSRVGPKHATLGELRDYWARGQDLLVYHHLGRRGGTHREQIGGQVARLEGALRGARVTPFWSRRGSGRVFLLACRRSRSTLGRAAASFFRTAWVAGPEASRCVEPALGPRPRAP